MNKQQKNKGKASINKKKIRYPKIINDSDSEEEKEKEKKEEKSIIKYPKDDSLYSISPCKTEYKKTKNQKKKSDKSRNSVIIDKTQSEDDTDDNTLNIIKERRNKKNKKKKYDDRDLDIEMRDETNKGKKNKLQKSTLNNENYLPCRESEQDQIYNYIKKGLETHGNYTSLYIAGMPGTGKTACVKRVIEILEEEAKHDEDEKYKFQTLLLCGTEYPNVKNIYRDIYNFIFSKNKKIKNKKYSQKLDAFFSKRDTFQCQFLNDPTNSHIVLVLDEIDFLINKNQNFLYNLFNWSTYENSRLIIITISNTLDLPMLLKPKIRSRMGNNIIMFKAYNKEQLVTIIKSKGIEFDKFTDDAIKFSCVKVAAINGDLRRTFQILLRAKELFNLENKTKNKKKKIPLQYIIKASDDLFASRLKKVMASLQICEKIIICTILYRTKDTNDKKINLGQLYDKIDLFFNKYNNENEDNKNKDKLELNWEEYKRIIYNLIRLQIINFCETPKLNFMKNNIEIKFYVDEFINACHDDKNLKSVLDFLANFINS